MSPLEYPAATAEPGRSVCAGNVPSGPGGTVSTGRPAFALAVASEVATEPVTPLTVSGVASGFALAIAARIRADGRRRSNAARRPAAERSAASGPVRLRSADVPVEAEGRPGTSTGVPMI